MKVRRELWAHQPITDFWRVGRGIAKKLEQNGMVTMGDVALCSERSEDLLYRLFGKNAELLIDHAWGWEPTTIEAIKAYRPSTNSISSGQVLHCPYEAEKARLVIREMTDLLVLDLVDKGLVTDQMVLTVGYDIENLTDPARRAKYRGRVETDPRAAGAQAGARLDQLDGYTSSTRRIMRAVTGCLTGLWTKSADPPHVRRGQPVLREADAPKKRDDAVQLDFFTDYAAEAEKRKPRTSSGAGQRIQNATLAIKRNTGKTRFQGDEPRRRRDGQRANAQISGHKA
ncbi:MAG: hypothetical protein ACLUI3_09270 [Christensenellales bacterium]